MEVSYATNIFESIDSIIKGEMPKKERHTSSGLVALKKAPNPIVFAESPEFLSLGEHLYPFQFATLRDFFELLCPVCNDVSRIRIKNDVPREDQILLNHNVCPACGLEKYNTQEYWYFNRKYRSGISWLCYDCRDYRNRYRYCSRVCLPYKSKRDGKLAV